MKEILLTKNLIALVDDEDFKILNRFKWCASYIKRKTKKYIYARSWINGDDVLMHRFILNAPKEKYVDHINQHTLDNRKSNLRLVSHAENLRNTPGHINKLSKTSRFKGVCWDKNKKRWRAQITINRKPIKIGLFLKEEDARNAFVDYANSTGLYLDLEAKV